MKRVAEQNQAVALMAFVNRDIDLGEFSDFMAWLDGEPDLLAPDERPPLGVPLKGEIVSDLWTLQAPCNYD